MKILRSVTGKALAVLAAFTILCGIPVSYTHLKKQDDPDTAVIAASIAVAAEAATAAKKQDDPDTAVVAKATSAVSSSSYRITATSTVRSKMCIRDRLWTV